MRNTLVALIVLTGMLWGTAVSAQSVKQKKISSASHKVEAVHRIVMQLSSADTLEQKGLMNSLKHLKEGWGDSVLIEVVVHGPGLDLVTRGKSTQEPVIGQLIQKGVQFVACRNTMKQRGVSQDQLLAGVGVVPMGIGEIVLKQEQGWTYIKAGF